MIHELLYRVERISAAIAALEQVCSATHGGVVLPEVRRAAIVERDRLTDALRAVYEAAARAAQDDGREAGR